MFTGIVQQVGQIYSLVDKPNARSYTVKLPLSYCQGINIGDSVANNGCCLTVVKYEYYHQGKLISEQELENLEQKYFTLEQNTYALLSFDLISTTLELTNLGQLKVGDSLNIERSFKLGAEVGGHIMSGHIDQKIQVVKLYQEDNIYQLEFALPDEFKPFVFNKGFVGIDGMSLTVSSLTERGFTVNLIPETLEKTTIKKRQVGDYVNFEIENNTKVIVNTVNAYLEKLKLK
ncbi:riboflavin synthase subunit alpha [Psittacicella melopsittaci]|uniref:Riboflavin synthase subunit alpha n=1 Tax=Psittacicella melopsittaci TaxID=2028576 RepID=A0A3A1Y3Z6_9GAMM|nr:riboflavin synthase subunit alpha [Psittacicella melopsittaci]RIY32171.1 riboflavin synthase subunit alpha [Psittacicella melopsittaci]